MRSRLSARPCPSRARSRTEPASRTATPVEPLEGRTLLAVFTVTNTEDSGPGSLRQAILDANAAAERDTIQFNIPGEAGAVHTISPRSPLPAMTDVATLDGTTQPGYADAPLIEVEGSAAGPETDGLIAVSRTTVRGLIVNRFGRHGVVLSTGSRLVASYIGTDPTGTLDRGNGGHGVRLSGAGVELLDNVVSGNGGDGVRIDGGNDPNQLWVPFRVFGNYIGTDVAGAAPLGNGGHGVNVIGATAEIGHYLAFTSPPGSPVRLGHDWGNVISANGGAGIHAAPAPGVTPVRFEVTVRSNFIGTDATGNVDLGNGGDGVAVNGGGLGSANVLGNLVSGNAGDGVRLAGVDRGAIGSWVAGNYIGTNAAGNAPLGNGGDGLELDSSKAVGIGGSSEPQPPPGVDPRSSGRNLISANAGHGVRITGTPATPPTLIDGHMLRNNFIGTNAVGDAPLGNGGSGVYVDAPGTHVLGSVSLRNVISANAGNGFTLTGAAAGNHVSHNRIGTGPDGQAAPGFGNGGHGVAVLDANDHIIGPGNSIAGNAGSGVYVQGAAARDNSISSNEIFDNGGLGIDLAPSPGATGVTPNDPLDADSGPNGLQNFPVITSVVSGRGSAGGTVARVTLHSTPDREFVLYFYANASADPSGHGEGRTRIGFGTVRTDAAGNAAGTFEMETYAPAGTFVTATASRSPQPGGEIPPRGTSEFSPAVRVTDAPAATVAGRHLFYNNSAFDGGDPAASAADDAAVAADKRALLSGQEASIENVSGYERGINGVMVDVANLAPGAGRNLTADDFAFRTRAGAGAAWVAATPPSSVTVRRGAGVGGSDRVTLIWTDTVDGESVSTAVANGWLEVTVKATPDTGLAAPDAFAFGHLAGEVSDPAATAGGDDALRVNALDVAAVKRALTTDTVPVNTPADVNRDGRVNALDVAAVKQNLGRSLLLDGAAPTAPPAAAAEAATPEDDEDEESITATLATE